MFHTWCSGLLQSPRIQALPILLRCGHPIPSPATLQPLDGCRPLSITLLFENIKLGRLRKIFIFHLATSSEQWKDCFSPKTIQQIVPFILLAKNWSHGHLYIQESLAKWRYGLSSPLKKVTVKEERSLTSLSKKCGNWINWSLRHSSRLMNEKQMIWLLLYMFLRGFSFYFKLPVMELFLYLKTKPNKLPPSMNLKF